MKFRSTIFFFATFVLVGLPISTQAVGVAVRPSAVLIAAPLGGSSAEQILIRNVTTEPALYEVGPVAQRSGVRATPSVFRLEAGAGQLVTISAQPLWFGRRTSLLGVLGRPLGVSGLAAASGVRIPVTVQTAGLTWWLWLSLAVSCSIGLSLLRWEGTRGLRPSK